MPRALHVLVPLAVALVIAGVAFTVTRSRTHDASFADPTATAGPDARVSETPAPTATTPPVTDLTVAVDALAHAPSGRTGIASVDAMIAALESADAATLEALAGVPWDGIRDCTSTRPDALDAGTATAEFAEARPALHSVFTPERPDDGAPRDQYALVFGTAHRNGLDAMTVHAWKIDVRGDEIVSASTYCGFTDVLFEPPLAEIERYLLLPPERDLPSPVSLYATPPATGRAALDAIVEEAVALDVEALTQRLRADDVPCTTAGSPPFAAPRCADGQPDAGPTSVVPVNECGRLRFVDLAGARDELTRLAGESPSSLFAIAAVPPGYVPAADAVILLSRETRRYNWLSFGLVTDGDDVVGLVAPCGDGRPDWLYPPTVLAGPFDGAPTGDGPTWSGIPAVDRAIVAMSNGDSARILDSFDPVLIGCVAEPSGIGSPPLCLEGETPGTLVPVLPVTDCEITYVREQAFPRLADTLAGITPRLYAVTTPPRGFAELWRLASYTLLIFDDAAATASAAYPTVAISESGIVGFASGCDASLTSSLLRPASDPEFLVPPPG